MHLVHYGNMGCQVSKGGIQKISKNGQQSAHSKQNKSILLIDIVLTCQKVQKFDLQCQFFMVQIIWVFQKTLLSRIILRANFLTTSIHRIQYFP